MAGHSILGSRPPAAADRSAPVLVVHEARKQLARSRELLEEECYRVTTAPPMPDLDLVRRLAPDLLVPDVRYDERDPAWLLLTVAQADADLRRVLFVLCGALPLPRPVHATPAGSIPVIVVRRSLDLDRPLREIRGHLRPEPRRGAVGRPHQGG